MKEYFTDHSIALFYLIMIALAVSMLQSCKKEEETAQGRTERLLKSKTWRLAKLTVDTKDRTNSYAGMELTFLSATYTAEKGAPVWPASGSWKILDSSTMDRDHGLTVNIDQLTEKNLKLSFEWTTVTYSDGRIVSISGNHVFEFIP